eukprot:CAMPEP_0195015706 /NCGR_PEP_ID=MMETSP0326_2-20130528/21008_1 /TAXON_ID=2866 ORGANISM="Crypthecodinium cohnii, Strain Seligo" /NCGR_SAMPLE_ID=MMETSP0326_2 /ASSEMBLY_ACC=CAM_ASM_000348 /LENGTH=37 /DNA_ID= /DNA_START= /DNA_END= /DNA_ORIENTATION=
MSNLSENCPKSCLSLWASDYFGVDLAALSAAKRSRTE